LSFYQEMCSAVKEKSNRQINPEAICRAFDQVFEEFCKTTGWPADKILFSKMEIPPHYEQKPSKVLSTTDQGKMGVMVRIECDTEKHEMPCMMSWTGGNTFRIFFEHENKLFSSIRSLEVKEAVELIKAKLLQRITREPNTGKVISSEG
jgi:hypothetical protein